MQIRKYGFTLIEVLFAVFIVSVLILTILNSINYSFSKNNQIISKSYAYIIADTYLNKKEYKEETVVYNNFEYKVKFNQDKIKLGKLVNFNIDTVIIPDIDLKRVTVTVEWVCETKNMMVKMNKIFYN